MLQAFAAAGACAALRFPAARAQPRALLTRPIPSTGEPLPVVGLGSWITFNVGNDPVARDACADVMRNFVDAGGRMIDSSPMYGSSQEVIGHGLAQGGAGRAHLLRGQGVDLVGRPRPRADRAIAPALAGAAIRSRAGPQPAQLAGASADAVRDEGGGTDPLRRHHDVGRSPPSRHRAGDAEPPDRLRAGHLQPARSRGRGAHPAARTRSRHRGDRESAVPRRRPAPRACAAAAARVGRGARLHDLGPARAEVHRLASRRHLRNPGDDQRRARPGEHERRARVACPTRRCASGSIAAVERA